MDKKSHRTAKKPGLVNTEYTLVVIPTIQTVGKYLLFPSQGGAKNMFNHLVTSEKSFQLRRMFMCSGLNCGKQVLTKFNRKTKLNYSYVFK